MQYSRERTVMARVRAPLNDLRRPWRASPFRTANESASIGEILLRSHDLR